MSETASGARPPLTPDALRHDRAAEHDADERRDVHATKAAFGERGVIDLIGVMGWYTMVSMVLNVDQRPLPDGQQPELRPLK